MLYQPSEPPIAINKMEITKARMLETEKKYWAAVGVSFYEV